MLISDVNQYGAIASQLVPKIGQRLNCMQASLSALTISASGKWRLKEVDQEFDVGLVRVV